ncbi:MAG: hypothetical protein QM496_22335 [Verrucomicrobiota bacterium]
MTFPFNKTLIPLLILITTWTGQSFSQELKIERKQRLVSYLQGGDEILKRWIKVGDDLYKARFIVPDTFLNDYSNENGLPVDPFADEQRKPSKRTAIKVLQEAGVVFGKGSSANYDIMNSVLTVVQTREQLELCEAYVAPICCRYEQQIAIRTEIYELPMPLALELVESCEGESDHSAERNAVRQLMKDGGAKLVALTSVISRSGQRSKIIDGNEVPFLENVPSKDNDNSETNDKNFTIGSRPVGTLLEVDPVLGADNWTIDLSLQLEHHTASPEFIPIRDGIKIPQFHSKEITTQVTLLKGNYLLVGTWKPTGKPEYEREDLMHVVFLTANVQGLRDYGVLLPAKGPNTNK